MTKKFEVPEELHGKIKGLLSDVWDKLSQAHELVSDEYRRLAGVYDRQSDRWRDTPKADIVDTWLATLEEFKDKIEECQNALDPSNMPPAEPEEE